MKQKDLVGFWVVFFVLLSYLLRLSMIEGPVVPDNNSGMFFPPPHQGDTNDAHFQGQQLKHYLCGHLWYQLTKEKCCSKQLTDACVPDSTVPASSAAIQMFTNTWQASRTSSCR